MNLKLSLMALTAFLAISGSCIAGSADPVIGTWKLNAAKSTGASIPKSETRTYAAASDGIKLTYNRVGADGTERTVESTYKYDGNDYSVMRPLMRSLPGSMILDVESSKGLRMNTGRRAGVAMQDP